LGRSDTLLLSASVIQLNVERQVTTWIPAREELIDRVHDRVSVLQLQDFKFTLVQAPHSVLIVSANDTNKGKPSGPVYTAKRTGYPLANNDRMILEFIGAQIQINNYTHVFGNDPSL
jgi:hypothetical protein